MFRHNDMDSFEKNIKRATKVAEENGGGILVITEGVFGMTGQQGKLKEIAEFKKQYSFRLLVDDAHGFGTLGKLELELEKSKVAKTKLMCTSLLLLNLWLVSVHLSLETKKSSDT